MKINKQWIVIGVATLFFTSNELSAQQDENRRPDGPPSIEQLMEDLDADGDERLSKKEVKGPLKRDFAKLDLDEDGYLTKEELEKAPKPKRRGQRDRNN
ncbi:MAG: EF-hand domain-containing protein [Bacteroidota bacterium]